MTPNQQAPQPVAAPKRSRRNGRKIPKKRFDFMAEMNNYQYIEGLATKWNTSMSKILNAILRRKPEPDEFVLR